jgi:uncharacterized membrane protein YesL
MQKQEQKLTLKLRLLKGLTLAEEARKDAPPTDVPSGRFKRFTATLKRRFSYISFANMLSLIFLLPLLVGVVFILFYGAERFLYLLRGIDAPYLMSNFGIGLSQGADITALRVDMLWSYRIMFFIISAGLPIFGVGLAGALHVNKKFLWRESGFATKKDKYGNNIPRITKEFFKGVGLYWKQTVIVFAVLGALVLGFSSLIIWFVQNSYLGTLNGGHYVALIFSSLAFLFLSAVLINLVPLIVTYNIKLAQKFKNALILTICFPLPNLFFLIFLTAPFLLLLSGTFGIIVVLLFTVLIAISFYTLMSLNFSDYNSEKILTPLYQSVQREQARRQAGKSKKKKKR